MIYWLVIGFFICQRLIEMLVAKRNEKKVKAIGAIEFGAQPLSLYGRNACCFFPLTHWRDMAVKPGTIPFFSVAAHFPAGYTGGSILGIMFPWDVLEYKDFSGAKCGDCKKGTVSLVKAS